MLTPERVPPRAQETTPRVLVNTESVQRKVKRDNRRCGTGKNFVILTDLRVFSHYKAGSKSSLTAPQGNRSCNIAVYCKVWYYGENFGELCRIHDRQHLVIGH